MKQIGRVKIFTGDNLKAWRLWGIWIAPYFFGFSWDIKELTR
jgi:hypothetical protein